MAIVETEAAEQAAAEEAARRAELRERLAEEAEKTAALTRLRQAQAPPWYRFTVARADEIAEAIEACRTLGVAEAMLVDARDQRDELLGTELVHRAVATALAAE